LRCGVCGAQFNPSQFLEVMDEDFERVFGGMPLDRL